MDAARSLKALSFKRNSNLLLFIRKKKKLHYQEGLSGGLGAKTHPLYNVTHLLQYTTQPEGAGSRNRNPTPTPTLTFNPTLILIRLGTRLRLQSGRVK